MFYRDFIHISCFVDAVFRHFTYFKVYKISYSGITRVEFLIFSKNFQKNPAVEELWRTTFGNFRNFFSQKVIKCASVNRELITVHLCNFSAFPDDCDSSKRRFFYFCRGRFGKTKITWVILDIMSWNSQQIDCKWFHVDWC